MKSPAFSILVSGIWLLVSHSVSAIVDANNNGLSDIWEKQYNSGELYPPTFDPQADPDGDGWTSSQEASAGTDPANPNPPDGYLRPTISHIPPVYLAPEVEGEPEPDPGVEPGPEPDPFNYESPPAAPNQPAPELLSPGGITLTWLTLPGKQYTLLVSTDLSVGSWTPVGSPFIGNGNITEYHIPLTQPDGSTPDKLFWRVAVEDVDTDSDGLTNHEESILGTSATSIDTDLDGIADNIDLTPLANNAIADPDGENLPASLATGLTGRWDLETITTANGVRTTPNTTNPSIPAYLGGAIEADNNGMVSKAVRMSAMNQYFRTDPSIIADKTSFSISFWFRFEKNYLQNKQGTLHTVLFAFNDVLDTTPQFQLTAYKSLSALGTQKLVFSHYDGSFINPDIIGEIPLSAPLDEGNWQHLTLTKSSDTIRIYRNSQQLVSGSTLSGAWQSEDNGYLCFGALLPATLVANTNFRGSMDRIRTWSRAITQSEITALRHQDIDRDGLWDITENKTRYSDYQGTLAYHPDPANPVDPQPTQTGYARSPFLYSDGSLDFDQDELDDLAEQTAVTNLTMPDTDGDNLTDGFEITNNFNPLNAYSLGTTGPRDDLGDPDSDTLTTLTEYLNGSNPRHSNSDGDAKNDAAEIAQGSDPANAADSGAAPTDPPEPVPFHVNGDYTAWEATIKGKGPNDTRTRRFRMSAHNVAADQTLPLLRGNAYELSLCYIRTKPGETVPWYCWEAAVAGKNTPAFTLADHWVVDNSTALLAAHTHSHGTNLVADKKVNLVPVEVESMDRYLSGAISESLIESFGGESKFGLVFRNPSSGETYRFNKLSEAHVYDDPFGATDEDEDKFLSNSEIAAWANGPGSAAKELTQDVVFYRKDGKLHFRTIFDQAGSIEIGLIKDGQELGKVDWTLKPDAQIADLLETVDNILSGNYDDGGGIVVAAMQAGLSGEDLNALQSAAACIQSSSSSGFGGFLHRNLTIKVNIPTWEALKGKFEEGARKAGAAVDRAITIATFAGKGFCEGAWLGVKDDATSLVELGKMILNPAETAKTFYEGFKVLIELDLAGWKNVGKSLAQSFLEKGNEGVGEWGEPNALDVASYLVGFTAGFITEQIAVTYVTAGILKAGNVGAKIGQFVRKASQGLLNGLAETAGNLVRRQAMKAKNSVFRRFSQDVLSTEDVKKLKQMLQELELLCPL